MIYLKMHEWSTTWIDTHIIKPKWILLNLFATRSWCYSVSSSMQHSQERGSSQRTHHIKRRKRRRMPNHQRVILPLHLLIPEGSSPMLDSELLSEWPGLLTMLLNLRDDTGLSQPCSRFWLRVRGRYWNVSRRKVVISSSTKQASIFRA